MTQLRAFMFLVAASLLAGCLSPRTSSVSADDEVFGKIVEYYQKTFPTASFADGRNIHTVDGPNAERLHVNVPLVIDTDYRHPFARDFLVKKSKSPDGRVRMIAEELLLQRHE